jgi:amidase
LGLAALVRRGAVRPLDLVEEAICRLEAEQPRLNLLTRRMFDIARAAAAAPLPPGPFAGVPFLLKDLQATWAGVPTGCGNRVLSAIAAPRDSELVRRHKAAGLVVLGKTNTPEFGLAPYTEPDLYGPTRNPWDTGRTPGGSSGGSAAAVAARTVPMAHGGDGGGSLRIPASCCGLFGLKPSRGRTPTGPDFGEVWRGFVVEHAVTRSVRDSAALLDVTAGPDPGAPYSATPPARPYLEEVGTPPGRLRIAYTAEPFLGRKVHDDCRRALDDAVALARQLGHEVFEAAPAVDREAWSLAYTTVLAAEARADIEWTARLGGRRPAFADFEAATFVLGLLGRTLHASDYAQAMRYLQLVSRSVGEFFADCDILLTPTLAAPPAEIGALKPTSAERAVLNLVGPLRAGWLLDALGIIKPLAEKSLGFIPYTPLFNVTGQPAMSVPLYWNEGGLPIGVQFIGRNGDEATLFRLAGQLEQARPWFDRAPPGC